MTFARRVGGLMLLAPIALATIAGAHSDDPKATTKVRPYIGPGYRASLAAPGGGPSFPAQGVTLLSWLTLQELGNEPSTANDCWGYTSASGREYAIFGNSDNTGFVEVTDPGNAQIVEIIDGPDSLWRDVKVYGDYAYAVSEGGSGIQVIDMSNIDNGIVNLVNTITTGGKQEKIIVLGGIAEVSEKGLTVLADVATSLAELDRAQFAETIAEMEEGLKEKEGDELDNAIARLDHFKSIQQQLTSTAMH